jgi:hypothetical protein
MSRSRCFTEVRLTKINSSAISRAAINTQRPGHPRLTLGATVGSLLQSGDEPRTLFTPDRLDRPLLASETT